MVMGCSLSRQAVEASSPVPAVHRPQHNHRPQSHQHVDVNNDAVVAVGRRQSLTSRPSTSGSKLIGRTKKMSMHVRQMSENDTKFIEHRLSDPDYTDQEEVKKPSRTPDTRLPPLFLVNSSQSITMTTNLPNVVSSAGAHSQRTPNDDVRLRRQNASEESPRMQIIAHQPPKNVEVSPRSPVVGKKQQSKTGGVMQQRQERQRRPSNVDSETSSYVVIHRTVRVAWEGQIPPRQTLGATTLTRGNSFSPDSWSDSASCSTCAKTKATPRSQYSESIEKDEPPVPDKGLHSLNASPRRPPHFKRKY